jgi:hypothetical protein
MQYRVHRIDAIDVRGNTNMSKTTAKTGTETSELKNSGRSEIEIALAQNDDIWIKRMLLFVTIIMAAFLGLD